MIKLQTTRTHFFDLRPRSAASRLLLAGAAFLLPGTCGWSQTTAADLPDGPSPQLASAASLSDPVFADPQSSSAVQGAQPASPIPPSGLNPAPSVPIGPTTQGQRSVYVLRQLSAPTNLAGYTFGALIRMANPPGSGSTYYPREWRVGGPGFGRNFGDSAARDQARHIGKYSAGFLLREDPRYYPSESKSLSHRAMYALLFTFIDRSNDGKPRLALSNLVGAAAGGYVGDAYLPPGFRSQAHATQRSLSSLGGFAGENVAAEFKPEIRQLLLKLHVPLVR